MRLLTGSLPFYYAGAVLVFALVLGGGAQQGLWSNHLIQILLLPALFAGLGSLADTRLSLAGKLLAIAVTGLVALQFVPLWRDAPFDGALGGAGWGLWSLAPGRSAESAAAAMTTLGFGLFLARFDDQMQMRLYRFFIIGVGINLFVAVVQLSFDQRIAVSGLLPFEINAGLFANENHLTSLVYAAIPFVGFHLLVRDFKPLQYGLVVLLFTAILFALESRAGSVITPVLAVVSFVWFGMRSLGAVTKLAALLAAVGLIYALEAQFHLIPTGGEDLRPIFLQNTLRAIGDHWLLGTGLGSFPVIYPAYESPQEMLQVYANHAHNDYLELLLETGMAGLALFAALCALLLSGFGRSQFAQAAFLAIFAIAIHSMIDYPLRTEAIALVVAWCAAVILSSRPAGEAANESAADLIARRGLRQRSKTA